MIKRIKKTAQHSTFDNQLLYTILAFLLFGLVVIYNATSYYAQTFFDNPFRFVFLQTGWVLLGLIGFFVFSKIDYVKLEKISFFGFFLNILFLVVLAITGLFVCTGVDSAGLGFSPCINGASRWFYINPAPLPQIPFLGELGFQPGELIKLTITMYLSFRLARLSKNKNADSDSFLVYAVSAGVVMFLLFLQPNVSTALLVFAISTCIYYASDFSIKKLLVALPVVLCIGLMIAFLLPHSRARLLTLVRNDDTSDKGSGYHIRQIMIALGSGGVFGLGFGQSRQKYQYLPEVASDSVFAIIGEEFGFIGTLSVVVAFSYLLRKGFSIAQNSKDSLGRMLAVGITSWIGLQFFVNVAAMVKLIPLTGVPMPLISYGGSSMIFSLVALGVLANISKNS